MSPEKFKLLRQGDIVRFSKDTWIVHCTSPVVVVAKTTIILNPEGWELIERRQSDSRKIIRKTSSSTRTRRT